MNTIVNKSGYKELELLTAPLNITRKTRDDIINIFASNNLTTVNEVANTSADDIIDIIKNNKNINIAYLQFLLQVINYANNLKELGFGDYLNLCSEIKTEYESLL